MPQKVVLFPGVGEVLLIKRRGAKNIRLSVNASGKVRVSMPAWVPYATGVRFAKTRADWLEAAIRLFMQEGVEAVRITRLARGLPVGGDLEYVDAVTLTRALQGRAEF